MHKNPFSLYTNTDACYKTFCSFWCILVLNFENFPSFILFQGVSLIINIYYKFSLRSLSQHNDYFENIEWFKKGFGIHLPDLNTFEIVYRNPKSYLFLLSSGGFSFSCASYQWKIQQEITSMFLVCYLE